MLSKKNDIRPFENVNSIEFLSQKNDCSLFMIGSHSKKRPNNFVLGRLFNYQILDMVEFGVLNYEAMDTFKTMKVILSFLHLIIESSWTKAYVYIPE